MNNLKGHLNVLSYVTFSPDGKLIVSASQDATIKIWNATSFELITSLYRKKINTGFLIITSNYK